MVDVLNPCSPVWRGDLGVNMDWKKLVGNSLKKIHVPADEVEDGETIIVRKMTIGDSMRFYSLINSNSDEQGKVDTLLLMSCKLACCMVNEDGEYLVPEDDAAPLIKDQIDGELFFRLYEAAEKLNPAAKKGEAAEKKS